MFRDHARSTTVGSRSRSRSSRRGSEQPPFPAFFVFSSPPPLLHLSPLLLPVFALFVFVLCSLSFSLFFQNVPSSPLSFRSPLLSTFLVPVLLLASFSSLFRPLARVLSRVSVAASPSRKSRFSGESQRSWRSSSSGTPRAWEDCSCVSWAGEEKRRRGNCGLRRLHGPREVAGRWADRQKEGKTVCVG